VDAASDKQASNIVMLDMRGVCSFSDYFVISSGETERQIKAIDEEIEKALQERGVTPRHREGTADSGWVLLDFGSVIVHIFSPDQREFYQLEELWCQATPVVRIL
jgi:ribosome-associated protein